MCEWTAFHYQIEPGKRAWYGIEVEKGRYALWRGCQKRAVLGWDGTFIIRGKEIE